jgi:Putative cyclase
MTAPTWTPPITSLPTSRRSTSTPWNGSSVAAGARSARPTGGHSGCPGRLAGGDRCGRGLKAGDFALLWYGWDAYYGDDLMWRNPYLSEEAARLLVDTGVTLVGTDTANVDSSTDLTAFPVHVLFLGSGLLIVENLRGIGRLGPGRADCAFLPLPLDHTDGAPVRAIAWPRADTDARPKE